MSVASHKHIRSGFPGDRRRALRELAPTAERLLSPDRAVPAAR
jgi:hypothetical protein